MSSSPISASPGGIEPKLQRASTLPPTFSLGATTTSAALSTIKPQSPETTLFSYHSSKIISFSPAVQNQPAARSEPADEEPVGTLPWRSRTERIMSSGSLRIYQAPASVPFLHSGSTIRPMLSKSQCWCVDGESKFVLKVRGDTYYRIELPGSSAEDKAAVSSFKEVLGNILQYESTPCPFKRGFHVELPEKVEVIKRPWKPKHNPIASNHREEQDSSATNSARLPGLQDSPVSQEPEALSLEEYTDRVQDADADLLSSSKQQDRQHLDGEKARLHVEKTISTYESMKELESNEVWQTSDHQESASKYEGDLSVRPINAGSGRESIYVHPELVDDELPRLSDPSKSEDAAKFYPQPSPVLHEGAPISVFSEAQNAPATSTMLETEGDKYISNDLPSTGSVFEESFTTPVTAIPQDDKAVTDLSSIQPVEEQPSLEELALDPTPSAGVESSTPIAMTTELDAVYDILEQRDTLLQPGLTGVTVFENSLNVDGSGTSNAFDFETPTLSTERPEVWPEPVPRSQPDSNPSIVATDSQYGAFSEGIGVSASPSSQLRRRFRQRRAYSPLPSPTVLHVPSQESFGQWLIATIYKIAYSVIVEPSIELAVLSLRTASNLGVGALRSIESTQPLAEDRLPGNWESDSSQDEFASVTSEDDFGHAVEI